MVHACPAVAALQQREECTNYPSGAVVIYTEDRNSDDEDSVMPPFIYLEDSNEEEDDPHESLRNPPSADPTPKPGPPSENSTKEPT